ncbi:hypothetical protein Mp_Vg00925 [Marchantia polymorpha subsp. ruderalis]|nr:hypothetical protein Mp_Vg00925 [Marchantia polymorpha subsp. ruderalis]
MADVRGSFEFSRRSAAGGLENDHCKKNLFARSLSIIVESRAPARRRTYCWDVTRSEREAEVEVPCERNIMLGVEDLQDHKQLL